MNTSDGNVTLRVHAIDVSGSTSDGPGVRALVFLQGCVRHCPGCHNRATWALDGGKAMKVDEVVAIICASHINRVTISGGEPLLQPKGVMALVREFKAKGVDDICLYTGFSAGEVPNYILESLKGQWLKTGEFRLSEKTTTQPFVGSRNQDFRRVA